MSRVKFLGILALSNHARRTIGRIDDRPHGLVVKAATHALSSLNCYDLSHGYEFAGAHVSENRRPVAQLTLMQAARLKISVMWPSRMTPVNESGCRAAIY